MGRKRLQLKKIDKPTSLQITYSKRKEGLIRKVNELSMLCDTEIGLLMFSPSGRLTCVTSNGSKIEEIFLRFINEPDEFHEGTIQHEEDIYRKLKHSKCEAEMIELIQTKETLQKKLDQLNRQQQIAEEKMRFYQPDVMKITSEYEADEHERYLTDAIKRIGRMKERLQERENHFRVPRPTELQSIQILDQTGATSEESVSSKRMRIPSTNGNHQEETSLPSGPPQVGADNLNNQSSWNFPSAGSSSSSTPIGNFNGDHAFQGFGQGFSF